MAKARKNSKKSSSKSDGEQSTRSNRKKQSSLSSLRSANKSISGVSTTTENTSSANQSIRSTSKSSFNLNQKSKSIQTKSVKSGQVGGKTKMWLKELLKPATKSGRSYQDNYISIHPASSITTIYKKNVEYKMFPTSDKEIRTGIIKMPSRCSKAQKNTLEPIKFIITFGKVNLVVEDKRYEYEEGSYFVVPKGTIYGLSNTYNKPCLMHFSTKVFQKEKKTRK